MRTNKTLNKFAIIFLILLTIQSVFISKRASLNNVLANECMSNKYLFKEKIKSLKKEMQTLDRELKQAEEIKKLHEEHIYLGEYTITAYCSCPICCGEYALNRPNGIVYGAAGIELKQGVSVASPLPLGTELIIDGKEYIVQDRTAKWIEEKYEDKIIDLYLENHSDAENFGKQIKGVFAKCQQQ